MPRTQERPVTPLLSTLEHLYVPDTEPGSADGDRLYSYSWDLNSGLGSENKNSLGNILDSESGTDSANYQSLQQTKQSVMSCALWLATGSANTYELCM